MPKYRITPLFQSLRELRAPWAVTPSTAIGAGIEVRDMDLELIRASSGCLNRIRVDHAAHITTFSVDLLSLAD